MSQVFHIFIKDVRWLWVEISASLIALGLLTWTEWQFCTPARNSHWYNVAAPLVVLFLSWWFIVVSLIQSDSLKGDRQFWVTRPYVWYKLLAAKTLFIVACLAVPLAITQIVLLKVDGAPVVTNLGEVILGTLGAMLIGILPVMAVAVITRSLPQWIACVVALIFMMIGMAWLDSQIPNAHIPTGSDISDTLQAIAFTCLAAFGITMQYARRHRLVGTLAIVGAVVAVPVIMIATPYRTIIRSSFPLANPEQIPFQVAFVPPEEPVTSTPNLGNDSLVILAIPIRISRIPEDTVIRLDGVMVSMDLPDGRRSDSEWQPTSQHVPEEGKSLSLNVDIDRRVYDRLRVEPIPVRLSVALTQLADRHRQRVVVRRTFELPGVGFCWLDRGYLGSIECRSTANDSQLLLATVSENESTCPAADSRRLSKKNDIDRTLVSSSASGPLSPISLYTFYIGDVCPGTPVVFSAPEVLRRMRVELSLGRLRLNELIPERVRILSKF
jgi:hypothetical protein